MQHVSSTEGHHGVNDQQGMNFERIAKPEILQ